MDNKQTIFNAFEQRYRRHHRTIPHVLRKDRRRLAILFTDLGYKKGAEIGVRRGDFSLHLCKNVPGLKIICIDPWKGYSGFSQETQDAYCKLTYERLSQYDPKILRMTSMEALSHIEDNALDFAYIDGDHSFDSCMLDIIHWSRKVRSGGIIATHDYGCIPEVNRAVDAYTTAHVINPWFITRETCSTAFWVKR